jgi:PEP-CTERM motif
MRCKTMAGSAFAPAILVLCVLCVIPSSAHADTAYIYQGNPFTGFHGTYQCPPQCGMLGFFIVATPLAANMAGGGGQFQFNVSPIAYVFTDGASVATNSNSCFDFFSIGTDSSGDIDSFTIRLFTPTTLAPCGTSPGNFGGVQMLISDAIDITIQAPEAVNFAAISQSPGEWSMASFAVPEPATHNLLLFGLPLGLLCSKRFRNRTRNEDLSG